MIRFKWGLILFLVSILLSGCGENPAESVYHQLEAAVELEIPFEQQQAPLQKAELRENELFEQIIGLGMDEYEEIETLANEALESAQAREAMLQLEKESIEESFEQFQKVKKED
ncbi:lipoprotein [Halalkalibacter wakoensis JCM 9140]|uniref:Lipoprotein n=1 Tax=Halalkalibacter wakoensis JCM 9140 TaxID=1236970 RepID=W4Q8M7_9BACI|nr:YkyA family protein [Halalkalibacter wakoensis]GAE28028.1 lipoprotein [Halalkalibacter wakoensis JCM 9140]